MAVNTNLLLKCFVIVMLVLPQARAQLDVQKYLPDNATVNDELIQQNQDKAVKVLEEKCKANAGANWRTSFDEIKQAGEVGKNCTTNFLNVEKFNKQISQAITDGKLDEVFKEYCDRKGELLDCLTNFTQAGEACLDSTERENLPIVEKLFDQLSEFVCFRNGDRIALFMAEKGPECIKANQDKVRQCLSVISKIDGNVTNLSDLNPTDIVSFRLNFDDEFCSNMDKAKECVVKELSSCEESTPSNIAEALFKYVKKALPCAAGKSKALTLEVKSNKATIATAASMLSVVTALLLL